MEEKRNELLSQTSQDSTNWLTNSAVSVFDWDWNETTLHLTPTKAPGYTLSFATQLESLQKVFGLSHDRHFSSQQLKEAAARDMLQRKLYQGSHAPFLKYCDVQHEHTNRPDHHLRSDPPTVIALRSRLRLNSTVFNSPLHQRRMTASPDCVYCAATPETVEHVLLVCPHYDSSRTALFAALGFRPPDGD